MGVVPPHGKQRVPFLRQVALKGIYTIEKGQATQWLATDSDMRRPQFGKASEHDHGFALFHVNDWNISNREYIEMSTPDSDNVGPPGTNGKSNTYKTFGRQVN